jgi:adenylate cyclase
MRPAWTGRSLPAIELRPLLVMGRDAPDAVRTNAPQNECWRRWVAFAHWQLLLHHKGHIVQQTAHRVWVEFGDSHDCLLAAFALNRSSEAPGSLVDLSAGLTLRSAAVLARYFPGERHPVEEDRRWAAELSALAGPGELLITAELRDRLANGLDADFEDLGPWTSPASEPLRLFRAHATSGPGSDCWTEFGGDLRPGLAIMPFLADARHPGHWVIGELIAEGVISRLSANIGMRVIARPSTSALRACEGLSDIERRLGAQFVVTGRYSVHKGQLLVTAELADAGSHWVRWTTLQQCPLEDLLQEQSELLQALALGVAQALRPLQVGPALTRPLPSFDSNCLMLASLSMGHHRAGPCDERGREALTQVIARHPTLALPKAWLALWHTVNVVMGRSSQAKVDIGRARELTQQALEEEPHNAMALAVEGYIQCQLLGNPKQAHCLLTAAIEANPSEPMAWLFKSLCSAGWDDGAWAVTEAEFGYALSPLDPLRYLFDLLMDCWPTSNGRRPSPMVANRSGRTRTTCPHCACC